MKLKYSLTSEHSLFSNLKEQAWWSLFIEDKELYVHIRKENYINIYYNGGSIAKIEYCNNKVKASIHERYLGGSGNIYVNLNLDDWNRFKLQDIKEQIRDEYPSAEKELQGHLITNNCQYIDSEFQYRYIDNNRIVNIRIDLVQLNDGILNFIELKLIEDSRLLTDSLRNDKVPEILKQMNDYGQFITHFQDDLITYYQLVCDIRHSLGLCDILTIKGINLTPKLLIMDTYKKDTDKRANRINKIKELLTSANIKFEIIKWR